jgi:hypothetical protein
VQASDTSSLSEAVRTIPAVPTRVRKFGRRILCGTLVKSLRDSHGTALGRLGGAAPQEWAKFMGTERDVSKSP